MTRLRTADANDAEGVALLHADSWRRHYRGAYADTFLDGDVAADRRAEWLARLHAPAAAETILAEHGDRLVGFIHVIFDADPRWGNFIDNLHVADHQRGTGVGTRLLAAAARAVVDHAASRAMYLWVLEQNVAAQRFYLSRGATSVDSAPIPPPGGDPGRLNGTVLGLRMTWPDATTVAAGS